MEIFHERTQIDFVGKRWIGFWASALVVGAAVLLLATRGLNYSIDFTGGTLVTLTYAQAEDIGSVRGSLEKAGYASASPQQFTGTNTFQIRIHGDDAHDANAVEKFLEALKAADPGHPFTVDSRQFVGPTVGKHLFKQAVFATIFSMLGIVVYVAFRFANPIWGISGVFALAHDVVAVAGLMSLLRLEFDLTLVAALLTLAGYSITDTIVVFDRIRERMTIFRKDSLEVQINASINETLSRTVITSLTVLLTLIVLYFFGGKVIHDFAMCMTFGIVIGTYSSIAVATPIVYEWEHRRGALTPQSPEPVAAVPGPGGKGRRNRR